jgi:hypothetical protein
MAHRYRYSPCPYLSMDLEVGDRVAHSNKERGERLGYVLWISEDGKRVTIQLIIDGEVLSVHRHGLVYMPDVATIYKRASMCWEWDMVRERDSWKEEVA